MLDCYITYLAEEEKSTATQQKYQRDIKKFIEFAAGRPLTKEITLTYKQHLKDTFKPTSVNSMLAALNGALKHWGLAQFCIKRLQVQRSVFCNQQRELTRSDYEKLLAASKRSNQEQLTTIIQTICATGIRVSELAYITVEAAKTGRAQVECKGKIRTIFITKTLQSRLLAYTRSHHIQTGPIFITKTGRPCHRSYIWRQMKALCSQAGVAPEKVFPHNLRHLFATTFYNLEKDIAKLADILGHSSVETTRTYIISSGSEHRELVERMKLVL